MRHLTQPVAGWGFLTFLICCTIAGSVSTAAGDDISGSLQVPGEGITQIISLDDGSSLTGTITSVGDSAIKFQTSVGELDIPIGKIVEIREVASSAIRGGKYWFPNPNRTRLYMGPTGRCLRQGEGYFTDVYLFFPGFAYGLTDNFSIGGGVSLFPGLDFDEQLFYLTPKVGVSAVENIDLAVTALLVRIPDDGDGDDDEFLAGVLFGTGTIGSDDHSLSFGIGYGFADGEMADKPAGMLGGEIRLARRLSFVSENWVFPEVDEPLVSYGLRFFGESLAVDLALFNILGDDALFPGVPFVDFVWNF
jgi:hypothetical protein